MEEQTTTSPAPEATRREMLGAAVAAAGALWSTAARAEPAAIPREEAASVLSNPEAFPQGGILERMRQDLLRALAKPVDRRRWVMVIDLEKCIGCKACTVSCVAESNLPPGVVYRPVTIREFGQYPTVRERFLPRPCMQCAVPKCVPPCPVGATYQRPDGIVGINYDQCIGCRYCVTACPYGARSFDFGDYYEEGAPEITEYETRPSPEYGENRARLPQQRNASPKGNARKCHFCLHRLEVGMLPACVTTCLGGATFFGDYNDEYSLVRELVGSHRMMRLKEELGTEPQCFYLV